MKPTEILMEEHKAILKLLDALVRVSEKLRNGSAVNIELLEKAVDFIRTFADKCHHAKEEHVLFRFMEENGIPTHGGPVGVMLMEHDQGRGYVKNMADAVMEIKQGSDGASIKYADNAVSFATLLSQHIDKEDNILYPMSEQMMTPGDEARLLEEFEKSENERAGAGVHEKYLKILEEIEKSI
ncbi:MAG TPA: hemerythrin domain-containing protein [bacterium]